jgi:hypothetical protein
LLVTILSRKASHAVRDLTTEIAGGGRVQNEPQSGLAAEGREGDPAEEASCREWLEHMRSRNLFDAAQLIRDGNHYREIAERLEITESKARRLITLVHKETRIFFHLEEKPKE